MSSSLGVARGRFLVGGFLVVAFLTTGTGTALAAPDIDLGANCEGWTLTIRFNNFDSNPKVTITIDGQVAVDGAFFVSDFGPIGGDWQVFQAEHLLEVKIVADSSNFNLRETADGCPESAPTTTPTTQAPTPTTQAPTPTTQAPTPTQTTSSPTTAASATTSASTTIAATTSTEATDTTTTVATTETSLVAAGSDDGGGGGGTLMALMRVLIGLAVAVGLGGAWLLGRRNAAPASLGDAAPPPPTDH